jgi:SNF2 family DNA or RNA helicase
MANHVMIIAPYHTTGSSAQWKWEAAMTQAIGRVARFGQKKVVFIHEFVTAKTIEADIWERHSGVEITDFNQDQNHGGFGSSIRDQIFDEDF